MARVPTNPEEDPEAAELIGTPKAHTSDGKSRPNRPSSDDGTDPYNMTADELRQFVERFEQLDAEGRDILEQKRELMSEMKGRGYDTKIVRKLIALRKRKPDEISEEEAVLEMYKQALGM